jgi:23S rRNA pseudouridine2604 synthase
MSEGLILLTNIGDIVNKILRARNYHEKEYVVKLNGPISEQQIETLRRGMDIKDGKGKTRPCKVKRAGHHCIIMILTEGRNRQIRKMVELIGLRVANLRRIRIMNINLGDMPRGTWRKLTADEEKGLLAAIE